MTHHQGVQSEGSFDSAEGNNQHQQVILIAMKAWLLSDSKITKIVLTYKITSHGNPSTLYEFKKIKFV